MEILLILAIGFYVGINLRVTKKINNANYLKENRRKLHKKIIWILPFLGPLLIKSFWQKKKNEASDAMIKGKRKLDKWNGTDNWQHLTGGGMTHIGPFHR